MVFKHDFIRCVNVTSIAASNTAYVTSQIRSHRIFNTDLSYTCAHYVVETDEKSSHNSGF